ncbi:pirin family protein [uncultured Sunxiuqinia sp.]|uniref:pirin family protein n=1 Tax=uncultured Sunxiuqinia sp. TaxID=1573825 RepID=UPI002AA88189|nr:pirin family protein [uncultured Sunxiuqinia sp.]
MNVVLYRSDSRGAADHGWLKSRHTFSFANYYCPSRLNFGVLRVLNDDLVEPTMGFGTHPHDNMEIVSIVLDGELEHKDSMGTGSIIKKGEVQVMSAGSGVTHSEFNPSEDKPVSFFQIWLFPNKQNVEPRYGQAYFSEADVANKWQMVVSPDGENKSLWIHQDARIYRGDFEAGKSVDYSMNNSDNGLFLMVIEGKVEVDDYTLSRRDAAGLTDVGDKLSVSVKKESQLLLLEVPMTR